MAAYHSQVLAATTAQSAMIESNTSSSIVINQTETWEWDLKAAKTYYTNAWDGNPPVVTCSGGGKDGCLSAPATPAAPESRDNFVNRIANSEQCTFFDGGMLSSSDTYVQQVNVRVNSGPQAGRGTWQFTYTYIIAPATPGYVDAHTGWNLNDSSGAGESAPVVIDATLLGQSVLQNPARGKRDWSRKYSFTLLDALGNSHITDLKVKLTGYNADGDQVEPIEQSANHTLFANLLYPDDDFLYTGNAGESGQAMLLAARPIDVHYSQAWISGILDGVVPAFDGGVDDFAHNDSYVGYTGTVHKAVMEPVTFNLAPGCYTATISANVKDVASSMNLNISGSKNVNISAGECGPVATYSGCTLP